MTIHDILPTKKPHNRIALSASDRCTYCGQTDTLSHRIIECGAGREMWRWTRIRMAAIFRSNAYRISNDVWRREEGISINETLILLMLPVKIFYFTICVEIRQILPYLFIKPQSSAWCSVLPYSNPNVVVTVASS